MDQTDPRVLLKNIAKIFEELKILYLVTGRMAVLIWGRPRFTADIDIVVEIKPSDIEGLVKALRDLGEAGADYIGASGYLREFLKDAPKTVGY